MDWSQVLRLRSLLKRDAPREKEGRGPEINTAFPQLLSKLKSSVKCFFVISDWRREVSLNPRWITSFSTEAGSESSREILEEIWDSGTGKTMCDCIKKADVSNDGVSNYCSSWRKQRAGRRGWR